MFIDKLTFQELHTLVQSKGFTRKTETAGGCLAGGAVLAGLGEPCYSHMVQGLGRSCPPRIRANKSLPLSDYAEPACLPSCSAHTQHTVVF